MGMGEELKVYSLQLINEVPHEVYVAILIVLCVGALILVGLYGFWKGLCYSLKLMFVEYVFLLYASTVIFRTVMNVRKYDFIPFWSYRAIMDGSEPQLLPENIMNVLGFVPVGVLAGAAFRGMSWLRALLIGAGLSVGIEVLQYVFKKGFCEVDDVMHNTIRCAIGYGSYLIIRKLFVRNSRKLFV